MSSSHGPSRRAFRAALLALATALALTSCAPTDLPGAPSSPDAVATPDSGDPNTLGMPGSIANTTWGTPDTEGTPYARFVADGRVGLFDGCNGAGGTWREQGGTVFLEDMAMSLIHCMGVDTWLSSAQTAVVDGTTITFSNADGKAIGSLQQTEFRAPG